LLTRAELNALVVTDSQHKALYKCAVYVPDYGKAVVGYLGQVVLDGDQFLTQQIQTGVVRVELGLYRAAAAVRMLVGRSQSPRQRGQLNTTISSRRASGGMMRRRETTEANEALLEASTATSTQHCMWHRLTRVRFAVRLHKAAPCVFTMVSRVVSVLDSGAEGPGFKSQPRRCRVTDLSKLFTPIVPLAAALLRVARVTAGLAESNGSLSPGL